MNIKNSKLWIIIAIIIAIIIIWILVGNQQPHAIENFTTQTIKPNSKSNELKNICQPTRQNLQSIAIGSKFYTNISNIYPGQSRYSEDNVQVKIKDFIAKGYAKDCTATKGNTNCRTFSFDGGKSVFNINDITFPVVIGPYAAILIDGHHDTIAAKRMGSETIPIQIIDDLSHLSYDDFYSRAIELNYIYPYDLNGNFQILPCSFDELVNDTNRYFAAIIYKKCSSYDDTKPSGPGINLNCMNQPCLVGPTSNKSHQINPLWIKIGQSVPFIEFRISTLLRKHGLIFDTSKITDQEYVCCFTQQAREILNKLLTKGDCLDQLVEPHLRYKYTARQDLDFEPINIRQQEQKKCSACFIRSPTDNINNYCNYCSNLG